MKLAGFTPIYPDLEAGEGPLLTVKHPRFRSAWVFFDLFRFWGRERGFLAGTCFRAAFCWRLLFAIMVLLVFR
jgi:hypothetical protein